MLLSQLLLGLSAAASANAANSWIVPGAAWMSTSNTKIDAHGGMVLKRGDTFYWVGQSASHNEQPYMYTSTNLLDWAPASNPQNSIQYMWRPKLAKPNGSFWIYGQVDRNVQALKSSTIANGYAISGSKVTLPPSSYTYSDTGMFMDDDETWYLLTSADHNNVQINRINSDGTIGSRVNYLAKGAYEAPGLFKVDGTYYLIVSGKTGWRSNPNQMFYATSLSGSWSGPYGIAPDAEKTYNSQNTFELTIKGSKKTTYIYMGDSWDSKGGPDSNYVWLPMTVDSKNKKVTLEYHAQWKIDVDTGEVSYPSKKRRYEAEHAEISGKAVARDCDHCLSKRGVHNIDPSSEVTFRNVAGLGGRQWVQFHYRVADKFAGEAHVFVNDEPAVNISSLNHRAGCHDVVPIELNLREGAVNTITFGTSGSTEAGIVLDGIEVVED
ncbi:Arabinanase/levansucrase/invertase [Lindgomyces ingoldianus]|uniref:Arabinanase/levansucrase/invertase n=1 Tax=Lindgomyces ingoldianus TaxID=673940 RepID=A0ACB6REK4_9PLEO|nr:Arabinanase/levansucrase/invertase [Lindgomyces ingoldianus]KAF2477480.1 Arabinanase/levansucrase/invertase [Lindgomyces ingoldianus]